MYRCSRCHKHQKRCPAAASIELNLPEDCNSTYVWVSPYCRKCKIKHNKKIWWIDRNWIGEININLMYIDDYGDEEVSENEQRILTHTDGRDTLRKILYVLGFFDRDRLIRGHMEWEIPLLIENFDDLDALVDEMVMNDPSPRMTVDGAGNVAYDLPDSSWMANFPVRP